MNDTKLLSTRVEWLKHRRLKRLGSAAAIAAAAFCAAGAPQVAAAAGDISSAQTSGNTKIHDATITAKAKAALLTANDVSSADIHVRTRDGNVVLTGSVPDPKQRTIAVSTVKQIEGVQDVRDQLTIRPK